MATNRKILGQAAPANTTPVMVYEVPASTQTTVLSIKVCNRGSTEIPFRLAVIPDTESIANEHYIAYDLPCRGNDVFSDSIPLCLATGDAIWFTGDNGLSITVTGMEIG